MFAFVNKLKLFETQIQRGDLTHFPALLKANGQDTCCAALKEQKARYATLVENLHEGFVTRFCDLQLKRPKITFLVDPFNAETDCLKAPLVTDEAAAELEMIDLCEEDQLKPALREGTIEFWKSVPLEKYPNVKRAALKIMSMFGSTYVCESVSPTLKHVKSKHRSVLTDTRERIASSGNNGIQARFQENCSRQGMPEVPLSNMYIREKRYFKCLYFCLWNWLN